MLQWFSAFQVEFEQVNCWSCVVAYRQLPDRYIDPEQQTNVTDIKSCHSFQDF